MLRDGSVASLLDLLVQVSGFCFGFYALCVRRVFSWILPSVCCPSGRAYLFSSTRNHYQPISVIVPPASKDKYTSSNGLSDEEFFKCMDGHYDTQVKSNDSGMMTVADVVEFVEENLGLEKRKTNPFDMFVYLDGKSDRT